MRPTGTKAMAEAALRELPSVLGVDVREDVHGNPREVHLLVGPGPDVRYFARDVREFLEERLGIPIDQRIISIAQFAPGKKRVDGAALAGADRSRSADDSAPPEDSASPVDSASPEISASPAAAAGPPARARRRPGSERAEPRLVFGGLESVHRGGRVAVTVRLERDGDEHTGRAEEVDAGQGRVRAAALAALEAVASACHPELRLELDTAALVRAFERDYTLVTVLAIAARLGRSPHPLTGAHPADPDPETGAVLAVLGATHRVLGRVLGGGPAEE